MLGNIDKMGSRLKELRDEKGMTLQDAAERIGTNRQALSRYEKGDVLPSDLLLNCCDVYDCDADYLLGIIDEKTKDVTEIKDATGLSTEAINMLLTYHIAEADGITECVLTTALIDEFIRTFTPKVLHDYFYTCSQEYYDIEVMKVCLEDDVDRLQRLLKSSQRTVEAETYFTSKAFTEMLIKHAKTIDERLYRELHADYADYDENYIKEMMEIMNDYGDVEIKGGNNENQ